MRTLDETVLAWVTEHPGARGADLAKALGGSYTRHYAGAVHRLRKAGHLAPTPAPDSDDWGRLRPAPGRAS